VRLIRVRLVLVNLNPINDTYITIHTTGTRCRCRFLSQLSQCKNAPKTTLWGIWATFLNSGGGSSTPEMDVPSPTAGSKVLGLSQKHHTSKRCVFTEFQASTLASTPTTFTSKRCQRRRKRQRNLDNEFDIRGRVYYCRPLHDSNTVPQHKILSHQVYQNVG